MFDRDGNLTDDADRMVGGCGTFDDCPVGDRDPMCDDAPGSWRPRCGGPCYEDGQNVGCQGCRHCSPPDHEDKPSGFGIERWEDPAWEEAGRIVGERTNMVFGAYSLRRTYLDHFGRLAWVGAIYWREERVRVWAMLTNWSARRHRHSRIVWDRLCDECETHAEARSQYGKWAALAMTRKYRDQR